MTSQVSFLLLVSSACAIFQISTALPGEEDTQIRVQSTSRRQGRRASYFNCPSEGFHPSSYDCQTFYRCVDIGANNNLLRTGDSGSRPKLAAFEFHCGPDTVFDPAYSICNHPQDTTRTECGGSRDIPRAPQTTQNERDNEVEDVHTPQRGVSRSPSSGMVSWNTNAWSTRNELKSFIRSETLSATSSAPTTPTPVTGSQNAACTNDGFYSTPGDCRKFYRCVPNDKRGYIKYDFTCGEGTVWDPDNNVCNYDWAVTRTNCGKAGTGDGAQSGAGSELGGMPGQGASPGQGNTGSKCNDTNSGQNEPPKEPQTGNGEQVLSGQHPPTGGSYDNQLTTATIGSSTEQPSETTAGIPISSTPSTSGGTTSAVSTDRCFKEGFFHVSGNCKKFYRCVEHGSGSYTRYDFECGEATVWDPENNTCNHYWAVQRADCRVGDESGAGGVSEENSISQTSTQSSVESQKSTTSPEGTTSSSSSSSSSASTSSSSSTATTQSQSSSSSTSSTSSSSSSSSSSTSSSSSSSSSNSSSSSSSSSTSTSSSSSTSTSTNSEGNQQSTMSSESGSQTSTTAGTESLSSENNQLTTISGANQQSTTPSVSNQQSTASSESGQHTTSGSNQQSTSSGTNQQSTSTNESIQQSSNNSTSLSENTQQSSGTSTGEQVSESSSVQEGQTTGNQGQGSTISATHETSTATTSTSTSPTGANNVCTSEGFFPTAGDCKKFHRCVDNGKGGFTKYDFICGAGTLWDPANNVCDHERAVQRNCNAGGKPVDVDQGSDGQINPSGGSESNSTTATTPDQGITGKPENSQSSSTATGFGQQGPTTDGSQEGSTTPGGVQSGSTNGNNGQEGSTPTNAQGNLTTPGEGQGSSTLSGLSTSPEHGQESSTAPINGQGGSTVPDGQESSNTSDSQSSSGTATAPCSQEATQEIPTVNITCPRAGFFPHPTFCERFYRCVDWDGMGERFSVYFFECGEGTIFDPSVSVCNHPNVVYPIRNCSKSISVSSEKPSSTQQTTESTKPAGTQQTTESIKPAGTQQTTESTKPAGTQQTTESTKPAGTQQTTEGTKPEGTTISESSSEAATATTDVEAPEQTSGTEGELPTATPTGPPETITNQETSNTTTITEVPSGTTNQETTGTSGTGSTVTDAPTITTNQETTGTSGIGSTVTDAPTITTNQESTGTGITVTEETATNTNEETSGNVGSTDLTSTTAGPTEESSNPPEPVNTGTINPTEGTSGTSETTGGTESTNTGTNGTTTIPGTGSSTQTQGETGVTTTEGTSTPEGTGGQCPAVGALDQEQFVVVCPTGFRRHPKYCDLFYQCTVSGHEMNILVLACVNGTVFDEEKIQCLPPQKAAPCQGRMAGGRFNRKFDESSVSLPVPVNGGTRLCPGSGFYPYKNDCSHFYKCKNGSRGKLEGYMYKCPPGYAFWEISRRCEKVSKLPSCARGVLRGATRQAPTERRNIGSRKLKL